MTPHQEPRPRARGRSHRGARRVLVAWTLALAAGGCSWIFVDGPPANHRELPYFTCTDSRTAPTLDVIGGGANVIGTVAAITADESEFSDIEGGRTATIIGGVAWTIVLGLSARSGFDRVRRCKEAMRLLAERIGRSYPAPLGGPASPAALPADATSWAASPARSRPAGSQALPFAALPLLRPALPSGAPADRSGAVEADAPHTADRMDAPGPRAQPSPSSSASSAARPRGERR